MLISVDLPDPDFPMIKTRPLSGKVKFKESSAKTSSFPVVYNFVRFLTFIINYTYYRHIYGVKITKISNLLINFCYFI